MLNGHAVHSLSISVEICLILWIIIVVLESSCNGWHELKLCNL